MAKSLELIFKTGLGKTKTLTVQNPILELNPETAQAAMNDISALKMFNVDGAESYAVPQSARYVERLVTDIFEVE